MPLPDLRSQAVRRTPVELLDHLTSFELDLRFSAGIWFFSPPPPGGTHELFLVYRGPGGDEPAPLKLNWIEFHGEGVRAVEGEPGEAVEHDDHDHVHHD